MNFRQIKAIESANKKRILSVCPDATEQSGIYVFTREDGAFKFAYIGQAKHLLTRLAKHLSGYQHIDLSLKKHGFYSDKNPTGYTINIMPCSLERLDEMEQEHIKAMANAGYQLRNKTAGGQGEGKEKIAEYKPSKGYRDGLKQGYENARRDVQKWCKRLNIGYDESKKIDTRFYEAFNEFLEVDNGRR